MENFTSARVSNDFLESVLENFKVSFLKVCHTLNTKQTERMESGSEGGLRYIDLLQTGRSQRHSDYRYWDHLVSRDTFEKSDFSCSIDSTRSNEQVQLQLCLWNLKRTGSCSDSSKKWEDFPVSGYDITKIEKGIEEFVLECRAMNKATKIPESTIVPARCSFSFKGQIFYSLHLLAVN